MEPNNLGIDTPADSDEEVDVVSVDHNYNPGAQLLKSLSWKDRLQLQPTRRYRLPQVSKIKTKKLHKQTCLLISHNKTKSGIVPVSHANNRRRAAGVAAKPLRRNKHVSRQRYMYKYKFTDHHSSDSDMESSEKRGSVNRIHMERQRRIQHGNLFENLKALVPGVNKIQTASKVKILRWTTQYCRSLTNTWNALNKQFMDLQQEQKRLKDTIWKVQKGLAGVR